MASRVKTGRLRLVLRRDRSRRPAEWHRPWQLWPAKEILASALGDLKNALSSFKDASKENRTDAKIGDIVFQQPGRKVGFINGLPPGRFNQVAPGGVGGVGDSGAASPGIQLGGVGSGGAEGRQGQQAVQDIGQQGGRQGGQRG